MSLEDLLSSVCQTSVPKLSPTYLLQKSFRIEKKTLILGGLSANLNGRIFIVGFGKAAYSLVADFYKAVTSAGLDVFKGVLSVPSHLKKENLSLPPQFRIVFAAPSNIPDDSSFFAGQAVISLLQELEEQDILITFVTGGGSALLTAPVPPFTPQEMSLMVKLLHISGAPIQHLNILRQYADFLKAGGLALLAYPRKVVSFILSDVIGSDLRYIASGPTCLESLYHDVGETNLLLEKYKLGQVLDQATMKFYQYPNEHPRSRLSQLKEMCNFGSSKAEDLSKLDHVTNILIGSNDDAKRVLQRLMIDNSIPTTILCKSFGGEASVLGKEYAKLSFAVCQCMAWKLFPDCFEQKPFFPTPYLDNENFIINSMNEIYIGKRKGFIVAFVAGGETTVTVRGSGTGGRSQEAALAAALEMHMLWENCSYTHFDLYANVLFFGTDGQDGPCDAAGAIASPSVVDKAHRQHLNAESYLLNNDSFTFWSLLDNGAFHIRTGSTGTNFADLAVIAAMVFPKQQNSLL